ncbi:N-acetylmuramoyl-L-alanine amidase [Kitasatospora gansuensis]
MNFTPGATVPNLVLVPVSADGYIEVYSSAARADVVVDLQGYTA